MNNNNEVIQYVPHTPSKEQPHKGLLFPLIKTILISILIYGAFEIKRTDNRICLTYKGGYTICPIQTRSVSVRREPTALKAVKPSSRSVSKHQSDGQGSIWVEYTETKRNMYAGPNM